LRSCADVSIPHVAELRRVILDEDSAQPSASAHAVISIQRRITMDRRSISLPASVEAA
jgi:hypothetical protein